MLRNMLGWVVVLAGGWFVPLEVSAKPPDVHREPRGPMFPPEPDMPVAPERSPGLGWHIDLCLGKRLVFRLETGAEQDFKICVQADPLGPCLGEAVHQVIRAAGERRYAWAEEQSLAETSEREMEILESTEPLELVADEWIDYEAEEEPPPDSNSVPTFYAPPAPSALVLQCE